VPDFFEGKDCVTIVLTMLGDAVPDHILQKIIPTKQQEAAKTAAEKESDQAVGGAAFGGWLGKHKHEDVYPVMTKFLAHLRADSAHKKIGAAGFCWGARYVVLYSREGLSTFVDAAVALHPTFLQVPEEIENIVKPVLVLVGDADIIFKADDIQKTQEVFKDKPNCEIIVYPDQVHGFSARGDLSVESDRKAKEHAAEKV
jgi:dienelactone hydrolase